MSKESCSEPNGAEQTMKGSEAALHVVDDDLSARKGVAALASSMGVPCETFSSAEDFLDHYDPSRAGCLLIDLRLTGMSGLELQERLAAMGNTLPVILVSAHADVPTTVRAMRNGALTLLEKPYRDDQLADAIRTALQLDRKTQEENAQRADVQQRIDRLTDRERQVMDLILAGKPNKSIARHLEVSQRTVDRLRAAVFEKMGAESAVEVVRMIAELPASNQD